MGDFLLWLLEGVWLLVSLFFSIAVFFLVLASPFLLIIFVVMVFSQGIERTLDDMRVYDFLSFVTGLFNSSISRPRSRNEAEFDDAYSIYEGFFNRYKPNEKFLELAQTSFQNLPEDIRDKALEWADDFSKTAICFNLSKPEPGSELDHIQHRRTIEDAQHFCMSRDEVLRPFVADMHKFFEYVNEITPDSSKQSDDAFMKVKSLDHKIDVAALSDKFLAPIIQKQILSKPGDYTDAKFYTPRSNPYCALYIRIYWNIRDSRYEAPALANMKHQIGTELASVAADVVEMDKQLDDKARYPALTDDPKEVITTAFRNTGIDEFFTVPSADIVIPLETRFEHMHIIAPTGSGKTTFLSHMLMADIVEVSRNRCSVVVMDSKRDLIKSIERSAIFAPGTPMHDKLVVLDVEDVEWPISLNLMQLSVADNDDLSPRDKEAFRNSTLSMLNYFFRSLLSTGAELTARQSTVFNFLIQLMMEIPNATLDTLIDILEPNGINKYSQYIQKLDAGGQRYFHSQFNDQQSKRTKAELINRIYAIKSNKSLDRMFSAPSTKLDLYKELSEGKVILINAAKSILQDEVEIFGRFMLAMILLAAERRQLLDKKDRLDTFVYMDEAQDILKNDTKIATILDQCRAYNVGMVISHQRLEQMSPQVQSALLGNCAIKCVSGLSGSDMKSMASAMSVSQDRISSLEKYQYLVTTRGLPPGTFTGEYVSFDTLDKMSESEYQEHLIKKRENYCYNPEDNIAYPDFGRDTHTPADLPEAAEDYDPFSDDGVKKD